MAEIFRPPVFANLEELQDDQLDQIQNLLFYTLVVVASADPFKFEEFSQEFESLLDQLDTHDSNNLLLSTLYVETFSASYPEYPDSDTVWNEDFFDNVQNLLFSTLSVNEITGTASITEGADTSSASGTTTVVGTLSVTVANDTVSASGTTTIVGTLTFTNADDTVSASGTVGSAVEGTANITEGADTSSASGTTTIVGTLSITNSDDTSSASGTTTIVGSLSITNKNDTASAFGVVGAPTPGSSYLPLTGVGR